MRGRTKSQLFVLGLVVLALVTPCWSLALTTFGKSNPQNNNNNQNNDNKQPGERVQARECETDTECAGIKSTSCLENIFGKDDKRRCLCGDYHEPKNGRCESDKKGVKVQCSSHEECTEGAQCAVGNATNLVGKRCWCMQGYAVDEDMQCSGSPVTFGFSALSLVASLLLAGSV